MRNIYLLSAAVIYGAEASAFSQQFQIEGTAIYSAGQNGAHYEEEKHFILSRDGVRWNIKTMDLNRDQNPVSNILFEEAGCDGTNIFYLTQYDTNKAYLTGSADIVKKKKFAPALGRVQKASAPPCLEMNLFYPIWFSYCSANYLSALTDKRIVAPLFAQNDFYTDPIPQPSNLPAAWELNQSGFVSNTIWFSEGKFEATEHDGSKGLENYPPPFDHGFPEAAWETTAWTNFNDLTLPKVSTLKVFAPDFGGNTSNNVTLIYSLTTSMDSISSLNGFSCLPVLTTRTLITDSRVMLGDAPVSYVGITNWDDEDQIKTKLNNRSMGLNATQTAPIKKRPLILLIMAGVTALFIAAINFNRVKKQTIK